MNLDLWYRYALSTLLIGLAFLCSTYVRAQSPGSVASASPTAAQYVNATEGTPIGELIRIMRSRNKAIEAARAQLRQAEARLSQARLRPNPSLDVERATDALFAREGDTGFHLGLSQPIELGGKRRKRMRVAGAAIELANAQLADTERQLTGQLLTLFGEALAAAAKLDLLDQVSGLNQQMARMMEVRVRSGDAARLDSSLLLATTQQVEAQRVAAENQLAELVLEIKTQVGLAPEELLVLRGRLGPRSFSITPEAALATALENRPDLRAARLREVMAEAEIDLAKAQAVPNPSVFLRYAKDTIILEPQLRPDERIVGRDKVLSFGLSIPLPLFNRQQGQIAEAVALRAHARAEREGLEQRVRRDVLVALRRYEAVRRMLDVLRRGVLTESQESFRMIKLGYDLGEMRLLDLVNQQRLLIEGQMSYAAAQKDQYAALVALERAMGQEIESLRR